MNNLTLGPTDLQKIGKGLLIALIGAALTYLTPIIAHLQVGVWTPVVYVGWSTVANIVWKLLDGKVQ